MSSNIKEEDLSPLQMAFYLLNQAKVKIKKLENERSEPIAVIGMGCRFPCGANNPEAFWELLKQGYDGSIVIPQDRWNVDDYYDPDPNAPGKMYVRKAGFLNVPVDAFDPLFFNISPREAEYMDPQQRLVLEVTWEALENAGINPKQLENTRTGVFMGLMNHDYYDLIAKFQADDAIEAYQVMGNSGCVLPGRISYTLGLKGPSFPIDTACSASLVALDSACQSLRIRDCNLALVGAVNLILYPELIISYCKAKMLSPDGICKTFDASADGYSRGEGCGVVVLKRLSDALRDNDQILALIKSSSVNHNGPSSGLTVPNGVAQEELISDAWKKAQLDPHDIDYIEAHGTGTSLGDPIEFHALESLLKGKRQTDNPLMIGSVKTNIGHLEAAAGMAGLIKIILALQHEAIPPHIHFQKINPLIDLDAIPAKIPVTLVPWRRKSKPRLAGISAFCLGGTNAHTVVEEAPVIEKKAVISDRPLHILTLSAKSEKALQELIESYKNHLTLHPELSLADVAFTANNGRATFEYRYAITAANTSELLKGWENKNYPLTQVTTKFSPIAFIFTDENTAFLEIGKQLYAMEPVFKSAVDSFKSKDHTFTIYQYALVELLKSWGIKPEYVLGVNDAVNAAYFKNQKPKIVESLQELKNLGCQICLEIGVQKDWNSLLESIAQLYLNGASIDWKAFDLPYGRRKVSLPTYPFQREHFWVKLAKKKHMDALKEPSKEPSQPTLKEILLQIPASEQKETFKEQLRLSLQNVLKLPQHHPLNEEEDFFDLGMDSIMALEIKTQLQNELGLETPFNPTLIVEYSTLNKLTDYLFPIVLPTIGVSSFGLQKTTFNPSLLAIPFQTKGSRSPLFCIHPILGEVVSYMPLSKLLGLDYPFYGIRAKGLEANESPYQNLNDLLTDYIAAIRSIQPKGPYSLLGWSGGCLISSFLISRLKEEGDEIESFICIDSPGFYIKQISVSHFIQFINLDLNLNLDIQKNLEKLSLEEEQGLLATLFYQAQAAHRLPKDMKLENLLTKFAIFKNTNKMIQENFDSLKTVTANNIHVFNAQTRLLESINDEHDSNVVPIDLDAKLDKSHIVQTLILPCNHFEIIKAPFINKIAESLLPKLR